jgi:hypothetical protein
MIYSYADMLKDHVAYVPVQARQAFDRQPLQPAPVSTRSVRESITNANAFHR